MLNVLVGTGLVAVVIAIQQKERHRVVLLVFLHHSVFPKIESINLISLAFSLVFSVIFAKIS
jgi:hypothetical protein